VAVSRDGVLGVAWFDDRLTNDGRGYDVYFAASLDGGQTFLPTVRVSAVTSVPARGLNILPSFDLVKPETLDKLNIETKSPYSERATGGDYSSLAVDAAGRFHPLWADARSGSWQVYTATIRVLFDDALSKLLAQRTCPVGSNHFQLLFDEPALVGTTDDIVVPVRILNTSPGSIVNTITVRLSASVSVSQSTGIVPEGQAVTVDAPDYPRPDGISLVDRFTPASPLFPNSVSPPLQWHLHLNAPEFSSSSFDWEIASSKCQEISEK
jgi:hypothetical protein